MTIYVTDASIVPTVVSELGRACPDGMPAGTIVQTSLVVPDATVEIMVTASPGAGG